MPQKLLTLVITLSLVFPPVHASGWRPSALAQESRFHSEAFSVVAAFFPKSPLNRRASASMSRRCVLSLFALAVVPVRAQTDPLIVAWVRDLKSGDVAERLKAVHAMGSYPVEPKESYVVVDLVRALVDQGLEDVNAQVRGAAKEALWVLNKRTSQNGVTPTVTQYIDSHYLSTPEFERAFAQTRHGRESLSVLMPFARWMTITAQFYRRYYPSATSLYQEGLRAAYTGRLSSQWGVMEDTLRVHALAWLQS